MGSSVQPREAIQSVLLGRNMKPFKTPEGVWMVSPTESVARSFVIAAMRAHGMNEHDFRLRDKLVMAVAPILERDLDELEETSRG